MEIKGIKKMHIDSFNKLKETILSEWRKYGFNHLKITALDLNQSFDCSIKMAHKVLEALLEDGKVTKIGKEYTLNEDQKE